MPQVAIPIAVALISGAMAKDSAKKQASKQNALTAQAISTQASQAKKELAVTEDLSKTQLALESQRYTIETLTNVLANQSLVQQPAQAMIYTTPSVPETKSFITQFNELIQKIFQGA